MANQEQRSLKNKKIIALSTVKNTTKDFLEYIKTKYGYPECYDYKFPKV